MQQLTNGTLLQGGKYRIEENIGQGGFGITYRACQPLMLGRKVCIKEFCLKQHFSRDSTTSAITYPNDTARKDAEMFQQKFIKEAQTLYSMRHPNIMEIYDIFEENNTAYYVMEYIEGESLKDMLERRGCIPEAEAIGYIRKVAEALKYIHSRNINHFDVKPANILVRSSDKEVILIDFGTAKHYDSNTGNATTMTSGLLSPGYAPIEQYQQGGVSAFTPETDIYALGATLYKLLTGITPPEPTEIISNGIPELPSSISECTKDLIKWAMQLNKVNRPHTCDEFLNALCVKEIDDVTSSSTNDAEIEETTYIRETGKGEETVFAGENTDKSPYYDEPAPTIAKQQAEEDKKSEKGKFQNVIAESENEENQTYYETDDISIFNMSKWKVATATISSLLISWPLSLNWDRLCENQISDCSIMRIFLFPILSISGICMFYVFTHGEIEDDTYQKKTTLLSAASIVLSLLIYFFILGNPGNFQAGDTQNPPLPGNIFAGAYKGGLISLMIIIYIILSITLAINKYFYYKKSNED